MSKIPFTTLTSISPLDGRYREKLEELAKYVSEYALIKTRFSVEARYLLTLSEFTVIRPLTDQEKKFLITFEEKITLEIAEKVKHLEKTIRHDVKAVERVFREMLKDTSLSDLVEMVHFGLTSEDINNISYRLLLQQTTKEMLIPALQHILDTLAEKAGKYKALPMLARTHGQAAVPTTLGKELIVFAYRLHKQLKKLNGYQLTGKMTGAVGNMNSLVFSHPEIDWISLAEQFVSSCGLKPMLITTQVNPYDDVVEMLQIYQRINSILIGLDQDFWRYISDGWFIQQVNKEEVGSSAMPQKVNPIDFENSEGNLLLVNALIEGLVRKLPISRLQRDLSDSTTIRNIGSICGYSLLGYKSLLTGLSRVIPNEKQITLDLSQNWSILTEGVQTLLRKYGITDPYSLVAKHTKGEMFDEISWKEFISGLPITDKQKKELEKLTPQTYIGLASRLTEKAITEIIPSNYDK